MKTKSQLLSSGQCWWWRHNIETPTTLLSLCEGNPLVTEGSPPTETSRRSCDVIAMCAQISSWGMDIEIEYKIEDLVVSLMNLTSQTRDISCCIFFVWFPTYQMYSFLIKNRHCLCILQIYLHQNCEQTFHFCQYIPVICIKPTTEKTNRISLVVFF